MGKYRELGVPFDGIIQDWQYWGHNYLWNAMDFTTRFSPTRRKCLTMCTAMNAHMAISIWSSFGPATKPYRELASKICFMISRLGLHQVPKVGRPILNIRRE